MDAQHAVDPDTENDRPPTDDRYLNPHFRGEVITPYERLTRPFWPLPYQPKHPLFKPGWRVRGWWGRRRWERGEGVTADYDGD